MHGSHYQYDSDFKLHNVNKNPCREETITKSMILISAGLFQNSISISQNQNPFCPGDLVSHSWHRVSDISLFSDFMTLIHIYAYNHVICSFPHNLVKFKEKNTNMTRQPLLYFIWNWANCSSVLLIPFKDCSKHAIFIFISFSLRLILQLSTQL